MYVSRRQELFAAAGAVLMSVPYLANLVVGIPLGHRFLLFAMFFLHLILARYLLDVLDARFLDIFNSRRAIARTIVPALLALLVGWNLALLGLELTGLALRKDGTLMAVDRSARVDEQLRSVAIAVCDEDVVMATRLSGWPLPSIVGKVVAPLHPNPLIADLRARTDDVHRFFSAETNNLERVTLLEKYGARRILFLESELPALVRDDLLELASDALAKNGYVLLSLPGVRGCVP